MSYILDAVRRSEQQRRSAGTGALRGTPLFADGEERFPLLLYAAVAAILITAGVLIGWLRPWQHAEPAAGKVAASSPAPRAAPQADPARPDVARSNVTPPDPAQPDASRDLAARTAVAAPPDPADEAHGVVAAPVKHEELQVMRITPYVPPPSEAETRPQPVPDAALPSVAAPASPAAVAQPAHAKAQAKVQTETAAPPPAAAPAQIAAPAQVAAQSSVAPTASPPPAEDKVFALYELPPAILREIPKMSISGYSYADSAKDRIVGINDRLMQEGQYLAEGLKLEQITPDGLIFSYKNYRFRKTLQ